MNTSNLSISSLLLTSLEVESLGTANLPAPTTIPPSPGQPDEDTLPPSPGQPNEDPLPPSPSTLTFTKGRNGGRQARYGGYIYMFFQRENVKNGNQYWCCKDNRKYDTKCNARLATNGNTLMSRTGTHCHPASAEECGAAEFLSKIGSVDPNDHHRINSRIPYPISCRYRITSPNHLSYPIPLPH
eukprot:sb/3471434/